MARTLNQSVLVGGVVYPAGTPEADVKGTVADKFWAGASSDAPGYDDLKVDDLKAEIERRNEGRDENDLIPTDGKKADLVAALQADDEA